MKKITALTVLVVAAFLVSAQSYRPFPESGYFWNEVHIFPLMGPCGWESHNCQSAVFFGTDTTINAVAYHRVYYNQLCYWQWTGGTPPPPPPCQFSGNYTVGDSLLACIRQDTALRKVFMYNFYTNSESLLYDFNLAVGDTVPPTVNNFYVGMTYVAGMDSVLLADGYHKRYAMALYNGVVVTDSNFVQVIEGVGSTYGLIQAWWPDIEYYHNLTCMSDSIQNIYPDASTSCYLALGVNETLQKSFLGVYPNPFTDHLDIQLPEGTAKATIRFYQADGRQVLKREVSSGDHRLNLPELNGGIYLLRIETANGAFVKKLVRL